MNVRPKDMDAFLDQYSRLRDALYYLWRYGEDLDAAAQARDFDSWVEYLSVLGATAMRDAPLEDEVRPINRALALQQAARTNMENGRKAGKNPGKRVVPVCICNQHSEFPDPRCPVHGG